MLALTGSRSELVFVPYEEVYGQGIEDMLHRAPSFEKIKAAVGWEPAFGLDDILGDVLEQVRQAPLPVDERAATHDQLAGEHPVVTAGLEPGNSRS